MEFLKIWEILLRRKWVFLIVFLIFFITVVIGTHFSKPVYKATAKILIESSSDPQTALLEALGLKTGGGLNTKSSTSSDSNEYDTEIELAKIKPLLVQLVSSLHLKARDGSLIKPETLLKLGLLRKTVLPQPYINVDQYKDAGMIKIESYSTNPAEAVKMSNQLAQYYKRNRIERTKKEYEEARILVESRIQQVKEQYLKDLSMTQDYKIKEEIVDLDKETTVLINKLSSLQTTYEDNEKGIVEFDKRIALVRKKLQGMEKLRKDSEEFSLNDLVKTLQSRRDDLLINMASKTVDITKEHPDYKSLEKQVETIKELLTNEAMKVFNSEKYTVDPLYDELARKVVFDYIDKETAIARRSLIQRYIDVYQKKLLLIPIKSSVLNRFDTDTVVSKNTYQKLLGYLTEINVAESIAMTNINVVEEATLPDEAYFPKKSFNYLLGFFLGLFWGLVMALFIEYIDNTIKGPEDLRNYELTLLGSIPKIKGKPLISKLDPNDPAYEAYRKVFSGIHFARLDNPPKKLLISSINPKEGSSTMVANIGIMYAEEGKKVLLVDTDLRRPNIHRIFDLPNTEGFTDLLSQNAEIEKVIRESGIEGLSILPSGPTPPDAGLLLKSDRMQDIIKELEERYDILIFDTAPLIIKNDAMLLMNYLDALIIVLKNKMTTHRDISGVAEVLKNAKIIPLGVILNYL
ncbi:MAG: polysaccharide biosynthesis tyrosine autokinase [Nitrospirota bacterium]